MAGYQGYSKSNNAVQAETEGRYPATTAARLLGVKPAAVKIYLDSDEWHHTGSWYNETPYYDISSLLLYKEGGKAALVSEGFSKEEALNIESLYESMKAYEAPSLVEKVYRADVSFVIWKGTRLHPRAVQQSYLGITVKEKGCFYTFSLPDGTEVRKKINSNGTFVHRLYTAAEQEDIRLRAAIENKLGNDAILRSCSLNEATLSFINGLDDGYEVSMSGCVYPVGRKPSRSDYEKGLENFFSAGEKRLEPQFSGPGKSPSLLLECWDGTGWEVLEKNSVVPVPSTSLVEAVRQTALLEGPSASRLPLHLDFYKACALEQLASGGINEVLIAGIMLKKGFKPKAVADALNRLSSKFCGRPGYIKNCVKAAGRLPDVRKALSEERGR